MIRHGFVFCAAILALGVLASSADAARRFTFETTEIEVEVQKPEVAVFISRENLHKNYRLELRESFVPRILESVENAPF
ncbi:MAG: hypothetical protein EP330_03400 [Deltaproteobacteria bacterium]|nr:MAG: hypothetical protein EP330_03400 [Deltaproteobacteria bacterium]